MTKKYHFYVIRKRGGIDFKVTWIELSMIRKGVRRVTWSENEA